MKEAESPISDLWINISFSGESSQQVRVYLEVVWKLHESELKI